MPPARLQLLYLTLFPPSPATFGAQRRIEGLMATLARRHRISGVSLLGPEFDPVQAERAMREYCEEVVLVPAMSGGLAGKRLLQLRALFSSQSFEGRLLAVPAMQRALDGLLRRQSYDVVSVEAPFLSQYRVRQAPDGSPAPRVVLDEHNIEHDLARQSLTASNSPLRRLHHAANWRKIKREEIAAWDDSDAVTFTSSDDLRRAQALRPAIRGAVIPNGVDLDSFRPRAGDPKPDGRTLMFFGTLAYFPNQDGVLHLLQEIWPRIAQRHPDARLKIVGPHPTREVLAFRGPRVEVTGVVDDPRPHLAEAQAVLVPIRVGGGTRFKILEAMAMGKAIVSTALGAEGIGASSGKELLVCDDAASFAAAAVRLLSAPSLASQLGASARAFVEQRYSWIAIAEKLEGFLFETLQGPPWMNRL